jgi:hypothetical protein
MASTDFCLQHQGLFHGSRHTGFPPAARSLYAIEPLLVPSTHVLYAIVCFSAGVEAGIKKRPSSSAYGKDEKRYVQSTHGFRGTTFIRCHLSIATSLGRGAIDKPVGLINSPTPHARSRGQPARSTLGEAGWFAATGLSIAPLSHDGDDWCSRATNGRPPISACGIQGLLRRMFAMGFPPVAHSLYATGPVTLPSKPVRYFFVV